MAVRLAHGWSQPDAAEEWNRRWPAEPKTFKNFSYWELWPAPTGHAPSLEVLGRLAELYGCGVSDLLIDCADYRAHDPTHHTRAQLASLDDVVPAALEAAADTAGADGPLTSGGTPVQASDRIAALVAKVEDMDVQQLARMTASWAQHLDPAVSRRGLLLKLSAGLSLAAADPLIELDHDRPSTVDRIAGTGPGMSGVWHSRYRYFSDSRGQHFNSEHYLVFRQQSNRLAGQSLPHTTGSRLEIQLLVDGAIATGTWTEHTSSTGHYTGSTYHGTLQLVVNPMGRAMTGKWLGFGKNYEVNTGDWELTWVNGATSPKAIREYHLKA